MQDQGTERVPARYQDPIDEEGLKVLLVKKIDHAMNDQDGELSDVRQDSLNAYLRKPYGNEREGHSSFVTGEVQDTIEWAKPHLLEVFSATDRIVTFRARGPEDVKQAELETDVANFYVKANDGFETLTTWFTDALMYPKGYVKVFVEDVKEVTEEKIEKLIPEELAQLHQDEEVEILSYSSKTEEIPTQLPDESVVMVPTEIFTVEIKRTEERREFRIEATPPEEVLVDKDLSCGNMDKADFVAHRVRKTFDQLVKEGYDPDLIASIGSGETHDWNDERTNRFFFQDENPDQHQEDAPSQRVFWLHECYLRVDFDGDGHSEMRRVVMAGKTILENERCDSQPFVALSAIPLSHKHNGLSFADLVKDQQLLNSTLWRQLLDNVYQTNTRKTYVDERSMTEDGMTFDMMMDPTANIVPLKGAPNQAVMPDPTPSIAPELLPVIQAVTDRVRVRTGVDPQINLDPDVLRDATVGVFEGSQIASNKRLALVTRNFAETGVKRLFLKLHGYLRKYQDEEVHLEIGEEWVRVNPSEWDKRTDMKVNVGIGYHSKDRLGAVLMQLLGIQKEAMPMGIVTPEQLYNTLERMVESADVGDPSRFFVDPTQPGFQPPQPPGPTPLEQAQIAALQAEAQSKMQKGQIEMMQAQAKIEETQMRVQMEMQKLQAEAQIKTQELEIKRIELEMKRVDAANGVVLDRAGKVADVQNTEADTVLKMAQAGRAKADAERILQPPQMPVGQPQAEENPEQNP